MQNLNPSVVSDFSDRFVTVLNDDDTPIGRIMKASKQKIKETEEQSIITEIANAIGDRRIKDLSDIIINFETEQGWSATVSCIIKAKQAKYSIPLGYNQPKAEVELLKYREVVFETFGCAGLEPIPEKTEKILLEVATATSSTEAMGSFLDIVSSSAEKQIENGNDLFFDASDLNHRIPKLAKQIESLQNRAINLASVTQQNDSLLVENLWYTELGRRALADLGISGTVVSRSTYELVLSVIQVSPNTKQNLLKFKEESKDAKAFTRPLLSSKYANLLDFIINQNAEGLRSLGSLHSILTLNYLLRCAIDDYKSTKSSQSYRKLLSLIRDHVAIRVLDSAILLNELAWESDPRLATPAISALGNYYHESIVSVLVNIICNTKTAIIRDAALASLGSVKKRCPEARSIVERALASECKYPSALRKFYKENWKSS